MPTTTAGAQCWLVLPVALRVILLAITAQRAHERGFWALEDTIWKARICCEAGGCVTTNVLVRELDLIGIHPADWEEVGGRRWFAFACWSSACH